jgi:steroid 5-alpha reductase family enzyme
MSEALKYGVYGCAAVIIGCFLLGLVTGEHSWVDRLWSLAPPIYVAWFASQSRFADARLLLMAALTFAWGARLTFNFARKGGYAKGGEDYRWPILRQRMTGWQWQLFAFGFVAGVQNVILFLLSLPAWAALESQSPLNAIDVIAAGLFLLFLAGETIADEQQWRFHQAKKAARQRGEEPENLFCRTGLFRFSRHPNFFCEQAIWWSFYLFAVAATGSFLHWTIAGPIVLTLLFHGSTNFTERITLSKYPSYADYQRTTSRLWPWPPG